MTQLAKQWHWIRREQRRLEEPFIVDLLESTAPDAVPEMLDELTADAIAAILFQLQNAHPNYWSEIRYHDRIYDFTPESPEATARQERFAITASTIVATLENRG